MNDSGGRILVVDDNRMNRLTLARSLQQQGHTVALAEDGRQALALLATDPFDLVLLDIIMPEMDGLAVLAEIHRDSRLKAIPVIVISAVDEMDSVIRCIEMGAVDYLPKPFNPVLLRARLNVSLEKKKLRDLEQAYLQQEMALRQSEKLATLGKLSAGMAHELNNPSAAALRGAEQVQDTFASLQRVALEMAGLGLTQAQQQLLVETERQVQQQAVQPAALSAMQRNDLEGQVESWLERHGVPDGWNYAPNLVAAGCQAEVLAVLAANFPPDRFPQVIGWLDSTYTVYSVLGEVRHSAGRVAAIVHALRSYSYLDQAPVQTVDIHAALDSTLAMLQSRLQGGITVRKEYAADLPTIQAYGSELNQVWTNMLDNAIDALAGRGEIVLRTYRNGDGVSVEIEDNGPGIPADIQPKVFDPFFTTKPPGQGVGLGLSVTHNIVVQKHGGQIALHSQPGHTTFTVCLPVAVPSAH